MTRHLSQVLGLVVVWVALWSDLDLATLTSGALVALVVLALAPPATLRGRRLNPGRLMVLAVTTLGRLIQANAQVAWDALTPGSNVHEAIVAVPVGDATDEVTVVIAASISLSPGMVTVDVRPGVVFVHVLHAADLDSVRAQLDRYARSVRQALGEGGGAP